VLCRTRTNPFLLFLFTSPNYNKGKLLEIIK
jgi:hypothetical protein